MRTRLACYRTRARDYSMIAARLRICPRIVVGDGRTDSGTAQQVEEAFRKCMSASCMVAVGENMVEGARGTEVAAQATHSDSGQRGSLSDQPSLVCLVPSSSPRVHDGKRRRRSSHRSDASAVYYYVMSSRTSHRNNGYTSLAAVACSLSGDSPAVFAGVLAIHTHPAARSEAETTFDYHTSEKPSTWTLDLPESPLLRISPSPPFSVKAYFKSLPRGHIRISKEEERVHRGATTRRRAPGLLSANIATVAISAPIA